jgi:hypothetical protein
MLTRRDVTRLSIKAFGLLMLLSAAVSLPSTLYLLAAQMDVWASAKIAYTSATAAVLAAHHFGPISVYAALGLGLMWWSGRIADRASRAPEDGDLPVASTDLRNIEIGLVTVIGLYFLADGFAELCRLILNQGIRYGLDGSATQSLLLRFPSFEIPWIVQALVKLAIGALLVLGRGATVATLHQARYWVKKWRAWPYEPEQDSAR